MDWIDAYYKFKKLFKLLDNRFVMVILMILLVLDLILFVTACVEINECPIDKRVINFMFVQGGTGAAGKITYIIDRRIGPDFLEYMSILLSVICIFPLIPGSVIVYSMYQPNFDNAAACYCSKVAYMTYFSYLTIYWIVVIFGFGFIGWAIYTVFIKEEKKPQTNIADDYIVTISEFLTGVQPQTSTNQSSNNANNNNIAQSQNNGNHIISAQPKKKANKKAIGAQHQDNAFHDCIEIDMEKPSANVQSERRLNVDGIDINNLW